MATAEEIDRNIAELLARKAEGDYELASMLFSFWKTQGYRLLGFRSIAAYLKDRFKGQEQDAAARVHARGFQRLIREFRLAQEIPAFKAAFDSISRSNRRLIAQVLTLENAAEWIAHARTLNYRELEEMIVKLPASQKPDGLITKKLRLHADQLEILERAIDIARELVEDVNGFEGPMIELLCMEFVATYGPANDGFKSMSPFECPKCGRFAAMRRRPADDKPDGDSARFLCFECSACRAVVIAKAVDG